MIHKRINLFIFIVITGILLLIGCGEDEGDHESPEVTITTPTDNQTIFGKHTLKCTATDNESVVTVYFFIDGRMKEASAESRTVFLFHWDTTAEEDSTRHIIVAQAYDASDNIGMSDTIYCIVDNRGKAPVASGLSEPENVGKHSITLSWNPSIDKDFQEYRLYRNTVDQWNDMETLVIVLSNKNQSSYIDVGSNYDSSWVTPWGLDENSVYYYRLQVHDTLGLYSASNVVSAKTKLPVPVVLKENYSATKFTATISWYKSGEDVKYYRIHRNRNSNVGSNLSDSVGITAAKNSMFVDRNLSSLTSYYYKVFIVDDAGYATGSNVIQVETAGIGTISLNVPVGDDVDKCSIRLSWSKSREEDDCEYRVYRATHSGVTDSDDLVTVISDKEDTVYTDQGLQQDKLYYYVVYLIDSEENIARSNEINVRTMSIQAIPLTASDIGKYNITLSWESYSDNDFAAYYLYRSTTENFDTTYADKKLIFREIGLKEYIDTDLTLDTQYFYKFVVADTFGYMAESELPVQTKNIQRVEITDIEAINDSYFRVRFTMNREDDDFQYYAVYRDDSSPDVDKSDLQVGTITSRRDTLFDDPEPATQLQQYFYRVYVFDSRGNSSAGSNVMGDTLNSEPTPVTLSFSGSDNSSIQLSWTMNQDDDFARYDLYRSVQSEFTKESSTAVKVVEITNKNTTTYTESGLPSGVVYYYCMYVADRGGKHTASNIVQAYTVP
ncbi:MAG: hypothetical protein KAU06_08030 [Candidatus Marinimicrobia bacterium]|nr:hypothetical protein [Candidatus Neomarinimicrobiota bacterium]